MMISLRLPALCAVAVLIATSAAQSPLESAVSYQGQLMAGGRPFTGTVDVRGELFDASVGGSSVGTLVEQEGVVVVNGLFIAEFDFGAEAFAAQQRWLEIGVRGSGEPGFTTLSPRQKITPAPQSLGPWTVVDGNAILSQGHVGIGTTDASAQLTIDGAASTNPAVSIREPGNSTGRVDVSSPNGVPGFIGIANSGRRRDIRFGDTGLNLVTSDTSAKHGDLNGLFIDEQGEVGIGTTSPGARLEVIGDVLISGPVLSNDQVIAFGAISSGETVFGDDFAYNSPKERVISIHSSAFSPATNTVDFGNNFDLRVYGTTEVAVRASVTLPQGATITRVELYGRRGNGAGLDPVTFQRAGLPNDEGDQLFEGSVPGVLDSNVTVPLSPIAGDADDYIVDNTKWAYSIYTYLGNDFGSRRIRGAAVWYALPGPD